MEKQKASEGMFRLMLNESLLFNKRHSKGFDQRLLSTVVWQYAKNDSVAYDSYRCLVNNQRYVEVLFVHKLYQPTNYFII